MAEKKRTEDELQKDFVNALIGAGQGATLDFGDELYGAGGGLEALMHGQDPRQGYMDARDEARARIKQAETESPNAFMAGEIGSAFIPGLGAAGAVSKASKLKKALQMAVMGGAGGLGRSEADDAGEMAKDTLSSAALSAGTGVGMDQVMRRIGDVIDFKKMRDKLRKERLEKPDGETGYPAYPGHHGRRTSETIQELQKWKKNRYSDEERFQHGREEIELSKLHPEDKKAALLEFDEKHRRTPSVEEYTPENALERVKSRLDVETKDSPTTRLISKVESEGADEPYVGRDYHAVIALENPRNRDVSQPLPVPPSKVGDLKGVLGKGVLTGDSDPFAWVDAKYGVSRALLEREKEKPLKIFTRSDLIGHDDYLEKIGKKHEVNMVFSTPNKSVGRMIEPGAPSLARRITAANKLAENGVNVKFHYQMFDNKKMPASWAQFQPSEVEVLRELREMGLNPSIKLTVEKTPIKDKNMKEMLNVLGLEMDPKMAAKERALDKARGRTKKDEE
jgi:hypothetical protein